MAIVEWTSLIPIREWFSKGFVSDLWQNNMNQAFCTEITNMRIKNGSSVIRDGFESKVTSSIWTNARGIVANNGNLYVATNSRFNKVNLTDGLFDTQGIQLTFDADFVTWNTIDLDVNTTAMTQVVFNTDNDTTLSDIATQLTTDFPGIISAANIIDNGSNDRTIVIEPVAWQSVSITNIVVAWGVSQPTGTFTDLSLPDTDVNFITFGIYTIILTGSWFPFVFDGETMTQLTSSNIETGANPAYWAKFANFTFVSGNWEGKKNILYISIWITAAAQTNSYDWVSWGSEQITMKGEILWLEATLNRLYIFTDKTIEFIDKWSLTDVWGAVSFYTSPIWRGEQLASHRSIVSAWDKVFYITKSKKIKTINYLQGSVELAIWDLSDRKDQSIQAYMDNLNDDLSWTWGFYDKKDNVIMWGLRTKASAINDEVLIYDITNDTFLRDKWYYYSQMEVLNGDNYACGWLNSDVYLHNSWKDDDGAGIEWKRRTAKLYVWNQFDRKIFRGFHFSGVYNTLSEINTIINVDGDTVYNETISWSLSADGIGNDAIWEEAIWDSSQSITTVDFVKKIGRWDIHDRGYYIQAEFSGNNVGQEISLDSMGVIAKGLWTDRLEDK